MRKTTVIEHCRRYRLVSRLAYRAFFLDDGEKTLAVALPRRAEEFVGVMILAYAIMSNHFHIFIYVPEPEEIGGDPQGSRDEEPDPFRPLLHRSDAGEGAHCAYRPGPSAVPATGI